ncbi:hypothetical protein EI94DRAFT_572231 [Lactarius quietus]|nr:hypothetical protein EI94DRAFT_572231 [Lactarius quietus]
MHIIFQFIPILHLHWLSHPTLTVFFSCIRALPPPPPKVAYDYFFWIPRHDCATFTLYFCSPPPTLSFICSIVSLFILPHFHDSPFMLTPNLPNEPCHTDFFFCISTVRTVHVSCFRSLLSRMREKKC